MTTEIATPEQRAPARWKVLLDQGMPSIAASLPAHVTEKKFRQVAATAIGSTPMLRRCLEEKPQAVLTALAQCAADGLLPDGRKAALVPFNSKDGMNLTYIPMIAGVLQRMRNSGEVESVTSRIVHANDSFEIEYGDDEKFTHKPPTDQDTDRGAPVGAYAIIRLKGGEVYREFMSKADIMKVKAASRAKGGPWSGPFETEMWRKTVLKRAAKYCPFSDDLSSLFDRDNGFYDPARTIDAPPTPDIRERFAADKARAALTDGRDEIPTDDELTIDISAPDASDGQDDTISDDSEQNDPGDVSSQDDAGDQGEAVAPDLAASPDSISAPIRAMADKIRAAKTSAAANKAFDDFVPSDLGSECSQEEFDFVESAKNWRIRQGH